MSKKQEVSKFQAIVVAVASVFLFGGGMFAGKQISKVTPNTYLACASDPDLQILNTIYQYQQMGVPKNTLLLSIDEEVKDPKAAAYIREQVEKIYSAKEGQNVVLDHFVGCLNK